MKWYARLNTWQRIGLFVSILWASGAGIHAHNADIGFAKRSGKSSYDLCVQGKEIDHKTDMSDCELERAKSTALYMEGDVGSVLFVALAPIPFGWLTFFIFFQIIKAQIIGFRAVVPWKKLNTYKKGFVILCVVFSVFIVIFQLMIIMNMYVDTKVPVSLSSLKSVIKTADNSVFVEGTWARTDLTDDLIMNPLQTTKIECIKQDNRCYQATASVSGNLLISDLEIYDVDSWSQNSIIYHDHALCGSTVYTIDLNTETVSGAGHQLF